jgi:hypothetical protein
MSDNLENRLKAVEKNIAMNSDMYRENVDFDNMPEEELISFLVREMNDEIKKLKNIADYHGIKITDSKSYVDVLRIYRQKYCSSEMEKYYTDEMIDLSGRLFDEYRDRIVI